MPAFDRLAAGVANGRFRVIRRSLLQAALSAPLALPLLAWPAAPVSAAAIDDALIPLQRDWEAITYQSLGSDRLRGFEALAAKAHQVSERYAGQAEPLVWEGIIVSSLAGEKGGLAGLGLVRRARTLFEAAIAIDGSALRGAAYNRLGELYLKAPGWPLGFGDKAKAHELLLKALAIDPTGIDANFCYGEYLMDVEQPQRAVRYLERALEAPARPGRHVADVGRREEIRALLEKARRR